MRSSSSRLPVLTAKLHQPERQSRRLPSTTGLSVPFSCLRLLAARPGRRQAGSAIKAAEGCCQGCKARCSSLGHPNSLVGPSPLALASRAYLPMYTMYIIYIDIKYHIYHIYLYIYMCDINDIYDIRDIIYMIYIYVIHIHTYIYIRTYIYICLSPALLRPLGTRFL